MTITFVSSQEDTYSSATPLQSRTLNVATGARTHGVLLVKVNVIARQGTGTEGDVTGITWNGQAMSQAVESGDTAPYADIWHLTEFGGGTADVVVTFEGTGGGSPTGATMFHIVVEWYDSDAEINSTPVDTDIDTADEDPTTVTVTNAAGDLIASSYTTLDNSVPTGSNLTISQDWDQGGNCMGAGYLIADGANETVGWDRNNSVQSNTFIHVVAVYEETAGGGTQYNQSAGGTLTTAGAPAKQTSKALAGTQTTAGAVLMQTGKAVAGSLTSAGALLNQGQKALAGALTTAGALAAVKTAFVTLAGTLTTAGTVLAQGQKALGGTLAAAGTLAQQTAKGISGTLTTAGTVLKQTATALAGTLTTAGVVAAVKTALITLAGTLTTSGTVVRQTGKAVAGTLTPDGALARSVSKALSGVLTTAGALARQTAKALAGAWSAAGALATQLTQAGAITGTVALTLPERSTALTLETRGRTLTLHRRRVSLTVDDT